MAISDHLSLNLPQYLGDSHFENIPPSSGEVPLCALELWFPAKSSILIKIDLQPFLTRPHKQFI